MPRTAHGRDGRPRDGHGIHLPTRRTGRSSRRSACRSSATACSSPGGSSGSASWSRWSASTAGRWSPGVAGGRVAMADAAIAHGDAHGADHPETTTGLPHTKLAMWVFLASECLFFGALITTYLLYRGRQRAAAVPGTTSSTSRTRRCPRSSCSRARSRWCWRCRPRSSATTGRMRIWLLTTALLGMTFVGGQVYEFTAFYDEGLKLSTNLFGTTFFVLTGFHGAHVTVGILMLLSLVGMSSAERLPEDPVVPDRDGRALLALRRHRLDRHLHRRLPDPDAEPGRSRWPLRNGDSRCRRSTAAGARRRAPEPEGVRPDRGDPRASSRPSRSARRTRA